MKHKDENINVARRDIGAALLGALGGAIGISFLPACEGESAGNGNPVGADDPTASVLQAAVGSSFTWVDTIGTPASPGELRNLAIGSGIHVAFAGGFLAVGDGGGGLFFWDDTSTTDDNVGTTINPFGHLGKGRWKRIYSGALNVKWFGAVGNGTVAGGGADDTAAIQATINAAVTQGGPGGPIFLPAGAYRTTAPLTLPVGGLLQGSGRTTHPESSGGSTILVNHSGAGIVQNGGPVDATAVVLGKIRDLTMKAVPSSNPLVGIQLLAVGESCVQDCDIEGFQYGLVLDGVEVCTVQRCYFGNVVGGVYLTDGPSFTPGMPTGLTLMNSIRDCQFSGGQFGIVDDGGVCVVISSCVFEGQTANSVRFTTRGLGTVSGCDFGGVPVLFHYMTLLGGQFGQSGQLVFSENTNLRFVIFSLGQIECYRNGFITPAVTGGINANRIIARNNVGFAFDTWSTTGALDASGGPNNARIQSGTAAPTTSGWSVGDIVWNTAPTAGGTLGWVCTAPNTWKAFLPIST